MTFVAGLRRLWRHALFRRLLTVRVAIQGADGLLQVALASFVLFSPERQPDAASIAAVISAVPLLVELPAAGVAVTGVLAGVLASPIFKSFARSAASAMGREISRDIFGTRKRATTRR